MPRRPTPTRPTAAAPDPGADPFHDLDEEFEAVARVLERNGLDPHQAHEVGRLLMVALAHWLATHQGRRPTPAILARIAAEAAHALRD